MSDTIQEGVRWDFTADASSVVDAYKKATDAGVRAGEMAGKAAQQAGVAFDRLGQKADASGQKWVSAAQSGASASRSLADAIDRASQRAAVAAQRVQALQDRFAAMRAQALASFGQGQGMSLQDVAGGIMNAGGVRAFMAGAGGPLAAGALAAGVGYGYAKQYSDLQDASDKAGVTARELDGLQKIMAKLGVDAGTTNGMMAEFARRMLDAGDDGAKLTKALQDANIAVTDANGQLRPYLSILSDAAQAIRGATDDQKKLEIATAAVGQTFASQFVDAVAKSETGLKNLQAATTDLSGSLTDDLGRAGRAAIQVLKDIGDQAEGTYAQIKRALNLAGPNDKINAAAQDVKDAQRAYRTGDYPAFSEYGPVGSDRSREDLAKDVLRAQMRLASEREKAGLPPADQIDLKQLGRYGVNTSGVFRVGTEAEGPAQKSPESDADADTKSGGRARGGSAQSVKQIDDHYADIAKKLQDQLALLQSTGAEHDQLALKMKIEAEQARLGADATQDEKNRVAELVTQIDAATEARKRDALQAQQIGQIQQTLSQDFTSAIDQWLVHGKKFGDAMKDMLRQIESQLLKMALMGLDGKSGILGGLLGGLFSMIPKFADGGDLPAGRIGLAGEAGAELLTRPTLVRGPASFTPVAKLGGGTSVTVHNYAAGVEAVPQMTDGRVAIIVRAVAGAMIGENNRSLPSIYDQQLKRA